jgi:hypothetical protein
VSAGSRTDGSPPIRQSLARAVAAAVSAVTLLLMQAAIALATDPSPTPQAGGDPRSPGQGPGFVGQPLLAVAAVIAVALLTVALTLVYVRLTAGRPD